MTVFDCLVDLDVALRTAIGPRSYNSEVERAFRRLCESVGEDAREVGEAAYARSGQ